MLTTQSADRVQCEVIGIDHLYIAVSDLARSEAFYDTLFALLSFRKNSFQLGGEPHVQYYNRHFGYVLRPARSAQPHDAYAPGLHHFCFRVNTAAEVEQLARELNLAGIPASGARLYPDYAPDYVATFFADPDGLRLEITNYRLERQQRHDCWDDMPGEEPDSCCTDNPS
ncbi:VOC family protein [Uliginosibacterium sp. 31-16]|uniref:VOC family protein n=1 Tax=Uliginosibacterium sp. 31-16 TaxID=3068315 RepID=UPI00273FAC6C|nr:VOC family protein [Uliginosibacterium sp. 31-16]MDP5240637.1 VOC family protein [Uliginosibacterium sp. 31-16]